MDWFLLGIEPTKDKKAINAAYRQKLRQTNPEEKPEEFKALRAAYEEALRLADQEEVQPARDESPVGVWMERIRSLYRDYAARIQPENWAKLLRDDVCIGLDTRPAAEEALLKFLMGDYFLPRRVWQLLDETFHFTQRVEELYESYPRDFIDHAVISGIRYDAALAYELFSPGINGADCDAYRRLYFQASQKPPAELGPVLEKMDALSEHHPYGDSLRFRFMLATGREVEAKEGFRKLAEAYPDNPYLALTWAEISLEEGRAEETESITARILVQNPDHFQAKRLLALSIAKQGRYKEAKDMVFELMHVCSTDPAMSNQLLELLRSWNEQFTAQCEARLHDDPDDTDNAIELTWCYIQNERTDDALEAALQIDPEKADTFDYHNLMGKLRHNRQEFDEALEHLQIMEQLIRELSPGGTEKTQKRINRLPEVLQLQGNCLMQLEENQAAMEKFEAALALAPEDPEVLSKMGAVLFNTGDYAYAAQILTKLIQLTSGNAYTNTLLALTLYRLRRDRDAFDAINRALSVQANDLSLYVIKMQILVRNQVWAEVHSILEFLENSGAPEDVSTDWIKAQLTELEEKDEKKAFEQYQRIARRVENGEVLLWASELYYRMAVLMGKKMDVRQEEDRDILVAQLDKGLAYNPQDTDCVSYKAWILRKGGKLEDAIELYRQLESKDGNSTVVLQGLAELYYSNLRLYAAQALEYYERLLQKRQTPDYCFYAATCKRYLGELVGARRYYELEKELDPDDVDGYNGLAFVCDAEGKYEESLSNLNQAIAVMQKLQKTFMWLYEHKVRVLRRMGDYDQALATVDEMMQRYDYVGFQMKFDICCQFGLWDRAKQVLDHWKKADKNDADLMVSTGKLHLLTGKMLQATIAMGQAKHKLPFEQVQNFRLQLAELECNSTRQLQILERRAAENPQSDYKLMNLAAAYWRSGNKAAARDTAQKALAIIEEMLTRNLTDEALYRSRRCMVLAILGREAEARADLEKTRKLPLCEHCDYGKCKDADIYEAYIEEIFGNREKALVLFRAGRANWPDELDFASGEARMKRKGK